MKKLSFADWFFIIILFLVTLFFSRLVLPYFVDIFMAILFVILFWKMHKHIQNTKYIGPRLASLISVTIVLLVIIIPFVLVFAAVINEAVQQAYYIQENWPAIRDTISSGELLEWVLNLPGVREVTRFIDVEDIRSRLFDVLSQASTFGINVVQSAVSNTGLFFFHLFIIVFLMYFLFLQGEQFLNRIKRISPLNEEFEERLLTGMHKAINGVVIGSFVTGIIDASFLTVLLLIFGVPSPILWGFVAFLFAFIPALGAPLIFVFAAIYKAATGYLFAGLILLILGIVLPGAVEQLIRPKIVSHTGGLNPAVVLVATFGGLTMFGFVGIVIGPVSAALFITLWDQFASRFGDNAD